MGTIAVGQASSCTNPLLDLHAIANGLPVDVAGLEFQVWSTGVGAAQVYPSTPGTRAPVVIEDDCPDGDRLGLGHYVARWTVPDATPAGTYEIRWFVELAEGDEVRSFTEAFVVTSTAEAWTGPAYTTIGALRAEGVTVTLADDARLRELITLASVLIETITRQWFDARAMTLRLDGDGSELLQLPIPIVSVSRILIDDIPVELSRVAIYNRLVPDDRRNPKITRRGGCWPSRAQSVAVEGVFGYVDAVAGGPGFETPRPIQRAAQLLIVRELEQLASSDRDGIRHGYRLLEEQTRDQRYKVAPWDATSSGAFAGGTGDPEVDGILRRYMKPIAAVSV